MSTTDDMTPAARRRIQEMEERAADARAAAGRVSRLRPVARHRARAVADEIADEAAAVRTRMAEFGRSRALNSDDLEFWQSHIGQDRQAARTIEDRQIDALTTVAYTADRAYDRAQLDEATARWWRRGERKQSRDASWNAAMAAQDARIELDIHLIHQDERDEEARRDFVYDAYLRAEMEAQGVEERRQREAGYPALTAWLVEQGMGTPEQQARVDLGREAFLLAGEQAVADAERDLDDELGL